MNSFSATARIAADAELKTIGQGQVCNVRLAVSAGFGERRSTLWINGAFWGARAAGVASKLIKGQQVAVTGELSVREYTGRDGKTGQSLELAIDRLDFVGERQERAEQPVRARGVGPMPQLSDEIPF